VPEWFWWGEENELAGLWELPRSGGRYNPMIHGSGGGKREISWRSGQGLAK